MLILLAVLLAVPAAALTMSRLAAGVGVFPLPQLAAFAPWAVPGWALVALLLLADRRWWAAGLAVLALGVHVWWLVPRSPARSDPTPVAAPVAVPAGPLRRTPIRVMTINVEYGRADPEAVGRLVERSGVDLLAVEELTPPLAARLDAIIGSQLPHSDLHPESGAAGTGIWSRWPLKPLGLVPDVAFAIPRATVIAPNGGQITVTAAHTRSPRRSSVAQWNRDLETVAEVAAETVGAQLVVGDFNATRDHPGFRDVLAGGLQDAADAALPIFRPGFTWPSNSRWPLATRIDHVLITPAQLRAVDLQVRRVPNTDHRAVIAHLVFTG